MMAGADRPSPRRLSQAFMRGDDEGVGSARNRTALLAFFGQVRKLVALDCSVAQRDQTSEMQLIIAFIQW